MADELRISGVDPTRPVGPKPSVPASARGGEKRSFKELLVDSIGDVQKLQAEADQAVKDLVTGEIADVSEALIAVEKADIAFTTMMQVRNKIIEAYQEVMRMPI